MTTDKRIYFKNKIQRCFLQAVLLFSVFAFSGFNEKIQNQYLESTGTELVDTKKEEATFSPTDFSKTILSTFTVSSPFDFLYESFAWVLANHNQALLIQYQSNQEEALSISSFFLTFLLPHLICSSMGEIPSFTTT